jgi:putative transcriptional regulator
MSNYQNEVKITRTKDRLMLAWVDKSRTHVRAYPAQHVEPNVRTIRRKSGLSQSQFAALIGVSLRTLQNRLQGRTRPTGPARALLRIVEKNPRAMLTLHAA